MTNTQLIDDMKLLKEDIHEMTKISYKSLVKAFWPLAGTVIVIGGVAYASHKDTFQTSICRIYSEVPKAQL